jgi:hypothetical protein
VRIPVQYVQLSPVDRSLILRELSLLNPVVLESVSSNDRKITLHLFAPRISSKQ